VSSERTNTPQKIPVWLPNAMSSQATAICTVAFAIGSLLVILFLFLPVIDHDKIARAEAEVSANDNRISRLRQEAEQDISLRKLEGAQAEERMRKVDDEEAQWNIDKAKELTKLEGQKAALRGHPYWYDWGMMFAFILLALSSLGYVVFGQTATVRVMGAVVIIGQILLVFIKYLWAGSSTFHIPGS
jgi:ABC-type multidrug transport system fused ATPase/permease subunit